MAAAARVLIVEDDREVRESVAEYLASHGYETAEAADGAAMRKALGAAVPDLVLLDVRLPGEDGLALARWLREHHDLERTTEGLGDFLDEVAARAPSLAEGLAPPDDDALTLPGYLREELRGAARDLGLGGRKLGLEEIVAGIVPGAPQGL